MADTAVAITAGSGTSIDTRTEATNGNHRQVVVLGDPATNAGVAPVDATNGLSVNVTNASLTVAAHAVTNAGTFAVQAAQAGTWDEVGIHDSGNSITVDNGGTFAVQNTRAGATTATLSNVADAATSATLKASNAARLALIIVNDSTVDLYVKYGATASATSFTYKLGPGETLREDLYTGIVDGIWASDASGSARVTELTA